VAEVISGRNSIREEPRASRHSTAAKGLLDGKEATVPGNVTTETSRCPSDTAYRDLRALVQTILATAEALVLMTLPAEARASIERLERSIQRLVQHLDRAARDERFITTVHDNADRPLVGPKATSAECVATGSSDQHLRRE
jgi:hypothetical protein